MPDLIERTEWIIGLDQEPVRRNLLITQCYHDLSAELARLLGRENLNWCSFATWASRTAGRFIRDEEVPALFRIVLGRFKPIEVSLDHVNAALRRLHGEASVSHEGVLDLVREIVRDVAALIGSGNLAVFGELGPLFSRMIDALGDGSGGDGLGDLAESLRPGLAQKGGQSLLRSALANYDAARREPNAHLKAERMLLANAQVGLHEQIRLQPFIAGAIDAPISASLYDTLDEIVEALPRAARNGAEAVLSRLLHPATDAAERLWAEFATKELMTLPLPDGTLVLGRDLPAPPREPLYPQLLDAVDYPEAAEFLRQYGADRPAPVAAGAIDWATLSDRMRYILDLFRSRQRDQSLLGQPFTDEQRAAIIAGRPLSGSL